MIVVEPPGPPAAAEAPQIEPSGQPASAPLGQVAVRSGSYLVAREAVGMVIRLVGIVITVRAIGPRSYGIYAGAAAYVLFMSAFAQMGSEIYLIRAPATLERRVYDQAFTFLLCTSFGATACRLRSPTPSPPGSGRSASCCRSGSCSSASRSTCCGRPPRRPSSDSSATARWESWRSAVTSASTARPSRWPCSAPAPGRSWRASSPGRAGSWSGASSWRACGPAGTGRAPRCASCRATASPSLSPSGCRD